jgi:hypothetical protein
LLKAAYVPEMDYTLLQRHTLASKRFARTTVS